MKLDCDGCYLLCTLTTQEGGIEVMNLHPVDEDKMTCPFNYKIKPHAGDEDAYWHKRDVPGIPWDEI